MRRLVLPLVLASLALAPIGAGSQEAILTATANGKAVDPAPLTVDGQDTPAWQA